MSNNLNKTSVHKASIGLLTAGLIISIFAFIGSIVGLVVFNFFYVAGILVFLAFAAVMYLTVLITLGVVFGLVNYIILFIIALIGAASDKPTMDFNAIWPEGVDWGSIVPAQYWEYFGIGAGAGLLIVILLVILIIASLFAMIFAIVALANVKKGKSKGQVVTGGVFALLSSFLGFFSLLEFIGAILAFIAKVNKVDSPQESPKQIVKK